jgi:CheY-like chemotaxis protein
MILIVEDEFIINTTITEELRSHGCAAMSACSADEALEILEGRADIEVVVNRTASGLLSDDRTPANAFNAGSSATSV